VAALSRNDWRHHFGTAGAITPESAICEDRRLIFEEAPEAYKDIAGVIADLESAGLIRVIARLRPLLSYKTRAS